jgi:formylglycine-generating enzyme required for sulfatase activity
LGVKYATYRDPADMGQKVTEAVGDELITGYRRHGVPRGDLSFILDYLDKLAQGQVNIVVGGDQIITTGPVAARGSALADHESIAVVGSDNIIVRASVYYGAGTTDPAEALRIYRRVLVSGSRFLPLRGVDVGAGDPSAGQKSLSLAHVYIDLDTKTSVPLEEKGKPRRKDAPSLPEEGKSRPLPALEAAAVNQRLVLLGDPGSGKSTFVSHLAHCLAAHGLEPDAGWLAHLPGWPQPEVVPIVIVLRDFARWLAGRSETEAKVKGKAEPSVVWEFIGVRLKAQNLDFAADALHQALEAGQALVLFDGLDEIAGRAPARAVRDAVAAFAGRYDSSRYLVTCRTLSYQGADWQLPGFAAHELAPFNEEKISRFVSAWYAELAEQGVVRAEDVAALTRSLNKALHRSDLWRLAPNPLLLTVMALVHTHKGRLPDARALLYEETIDILLWRWEQIKAGGDTEERPPLRQLLLQANRSDVDLKRVLWRLAFEAHAQGGAGGDGEAVADIGEMRLLKELGSLCCGDLGWAQQVVEAMKLRAGLLIERQPEVFTFPHRTFQEYLAGAHLAAQADFARRAAGLVSEGAQWREVITLAAGKLVYLSGDLDKPLALVAELCPSKTHDTDLGWQKVWLAGDVLLEVGLSRVNDLELGRDLVARVRDRLAELATLGKLKPVERARAGDTLGRLGDSRSGVGLTAEGLPDIAWCDVPAGEFIMGSLDDPKEPYLGKETPQHRLKLGAYRISKYPVTVAQFNAFVRDGGYRVARYWRQAVAAGRWRDGQIRAYQWRPELSRSEEGWFDGPGDSGLPFTLPNHPIVDVSWYEALAFCAWLDEKTGLRIGLPTEAQWERVARGTDGRDYPWGEGITPEHANYQETGIGATSAANIFSKGASPYGVLDLSGNVWEWTANLWGEDYQKSTYNYPYRAGDGRENLDAPATVLRVLRGGAYDNSARLVRCAARYWGNPDLRLDGLGFRVVASPVP